MDELASLGSQGPGTCTSSSICSTVAGPPVRSRLAEMTSSNWQLLFGLRRRNTGEKEKDVYSFLALPALSFSLYVLMGKDFQNVSTQNAVGGLHFLWL